MSTETPESHRGEEDACQEFPIAYELNSTLGRGLERKLKSCKGERRQRSYSSGSPAARHALPLRKRKARLMTATLALPPQSTIAIEQCTDTAFAEPTQARQPQKREEI